MKNIFDDSKKVSRKLKMWSLCNSSSCRQQLAHSVFQAKYETWCALPFLKRLHIRYSSQLVPPSCVRTEYSLESLKQYYMAIWFFHLVSLKYVEGGTCQLCRTIGINKRAVSTPMMMSWIEARINSSHTSHNYQMAS